MKHVICIEINLNSGRAIGTFVPEDKAISWLKRLHDLDFPLEASIKVMPNYHGCHVDPDMTFEQMVRGLVKAI